MVCSVVGVVGVAAPDVVKYVLATYPVFDPYFTFDQDPSTARTVTVFPFGIVSNTVVFVDFDERRFKLAFV